MLPLILVAASPHAQMQLVFQLSIPPPKHPGCFCKSSQQKRSQIQVHLITTPATAAGGLSFSPTDKDSSIASFGETGLISIPPPLVPPPPCCFMPHASPRSPGLGKLHGDLILSIHIVTRAPESHAIISRGAWRALTPESGLCQLELGGRLVLGQCWEQSAPVSRVPPRCGRSVS